MITSSGDQAKKRRPDIDGLRAIAVLAVVIFHIDQRLLPGGFTGVDIFFVISGYVISNSLYPQGQSAFPKFSSFYARRVRRLAPALLIVIGVTCVGMSFIISPYLFDLSTGYSSAEFGLVGLANVKFAADPYGSYFSNGVVTRTDPFLHLWSLGVEEQFYFVFPVIMCGLLSQQCWIPVLLFVSAVLSAVLANVLESKSAFYLMPARYWELSCGVVIYYLQHFAPQWISKVTDDIPILTHTVILVLFVVSFLAPESQKFPSLGVSPAIAGAMLFITAGMHDNYRYLNAWCSHPILVYIGRISYPIYLWHWPLLVLGDYLCAGQESTGLCTSNYRLVMTVAVVAALSVATFALESSISTLKSSARYLLCAIVVAELCLFSLQGSLYGRLYLDRSFGDRSPLYMAAWDDACFPQMHHIVNSGSFVDCLTPSDKTKRTLFIVGDSHAAALVYGMQRVLSSWNVVYAAVGAGCGFLPPAMIPQELLVHHGFPINLCERYNSEVLSALFKHLTQGSVVLIAHTHDRFRLQNLQKIGLQNLTDYIEFLGTLHQLTSRRQAELLLVGDTPSFLKPGWLCEPTLFRNLSEVCKTPRWQVQQKLAPLLDALHNFSSRANDVHFFPYHTSFCNEDICDVFLPGTETLGVFDTGHMTTDGSLHVARTLGKIVHYL